MPVQALRARPPWDASWNGPAKVMLVAAVSAPRAISPGARPEDRALRATGGALFGGRAHRRVRVAGDDRAEIVHQDDGGAPAHLARHRRGPRRPGHGRLERFTRLGAFRQFRHGVEARLSW